MQHTRRLIASSLLLTAGLFAACGGSDAPDETTTPSTNAPTGETASGTAAAGSPSGSPAGSATTTATGVATSSATAPPGSATVSPAPGTPSADASEAFRNLARDNSDETIAITYAISVVEDGVQRDGTWRISQDPPKSAVYFAFEGDNGGEFWVINDGESAIVCFDTEDEAGQCIKTGDASTADSLVPDVVDVDESVDTAESAASIREVDGRTIAGQRARCFEYDAEGTAEDGTICLDSDDGTMLFLSSTDVEMTATEVADSVPAGSFEPPFDVLDLGG